MSDASTCTIRQIVGSFLAVHRADVKRLLSSAVSFTATVVGTHGCGEEGRGGVSLGVPRGRGQYNGYERTKRSIGPVHLLGWIDPALISQLNTWYRAYFSDSKNSASSLFLNSSNSSLVSVVVR